MDAKGIEGFVLADKPVLDWNHVPIGTVVDMRKDPRTNATRSIVVTLTPDAQKRMGVTEDLVTIPVSMVFGIRKDSLTLDRGLTEILRASARESSVLTR